MKLHEIFENMDSSTDIQDFIISQFEQDELSFAEAKEQIMKLPGADFWMMELQSAADMKDPTEFDFGEKRRVDQVAQRHMQTINRPLRKN